MMITRFNRMFERHGRTAFLVLAVIFVVPLVLFVTPGRRGGGAGGDGRDDDIGQMYGRDIDPEEFHETLRATDVTLALQFGQFPSEDARLFSFLVEQTCRRMRAVREAKRLGLDQVSGVEIAAHMRAQRAFLTDGAFDKSKLAQYMTMLRDRRGIDGKAFDRIARESIMVQRLEAAAEDGVFVSPQEVRDEFDRENEKLAAKILEYKYTDLVKEEHLGPGLKEVDEYFAAHRSELRTPAPKRIRVAKVLESAYRDAVKITDKQVKDYYDKNKATYDEKKQSFEDAKSDIDLTLRRGPARQKAAEAARQLLLKLKTGRNKDKAADPAALFSKVCQELKIEAVDCGPITPEDETIEGLGKLPRVLSQAYELGEEKPHSDLIYDTGDYYIACWLETLEGQVPETLTDWVRRDVAERLAKQMAKAYWDEQIEPFRAQLAGGKSPEDLIAANAAAVDADAEETAEEKAAAKAAFAEKIGTLLTPHYVAKQQQVRIALFRPASFRAHAKITPEEVTGYYEEHRAEYDVEEVRARQIVLRYPPGATLQQKASQRKRMDLYLARVQKGEDFAQLASKVTEDFTNKKRGGDLGYFIRGMKAKEICDAAFALKKGEISPVFETRVGCYILKLEDRRGRPETKIRTMISRKLTDQRMNDLAWKAAEAFAEKAAAAVPKREQGQTPAEAFSALAKADSLVTTRDSDWFGSGVKLPPLGTQPELVSAAFELTEKQPVSGAVKGRLEHYVACWLGTEQGHLPQFGENAESVASIQTELRRGEAREYYETHTGPFRERLAGGKTVREMHSAYAGELRQMKDKPDAEKRELLTEFGEKVSEHVQPYFVDMQRRARVATFSPKNFVVPASKKLTDAAIKAYYDENPGKYARDEARARQIMLKLPADADAAKKAEVRKKIDGILAQIREGEDFAGLARLHSEDTASKGKGGDMGYFPRGRVVKELDDVIFKLDAGEISSVVEGKTALYLVKVEDRRTRRPLAAVALTIREELANEESVRLAEKGARKLANKLYTRIFGNRARLSVDSAGKVAPPAELMLEEAVAIGVPTKDTEWYGGRGPIPPFGFEQELGQEVYKLNSHTALSRVIKGRDDFYVACWLATKEAYLPEFDEVAVTVERKVKEERAKALSRERAAQVHAAVRAEMDTGKAFDEAASDYPFETSADFTLNQPPSKIVGGGDISKAAADAAAGTLLEPIETANGAALVYLVSRTAATDKEYEEGKQAVLDRLTQQKRSASRLALYERLEQESNTVLKGRWGAGS